MQIDLNCDLGEGFAFDNELMPLITSANIACGFHAGDPETAQRTLTLAAQNHVQAGTHPSFFDRENFGRREMVRSEQQIFADCVYQVGALIALARTTGSSIRHIKPHGALYNMACREDAVARPMLAVAEFFGLPLLGLPGSRLEALSADRCRFVAEGFADRRYQEDGSLVPRSRPDAMIHDPQEAVKQVEWLMRNRGVRTICVHGDNPQAVVFVKELRQALTAAGHQLVAIGDQQ